MFTSRVKFWKRYQSTCHPERSSRRTLRFFNSHLTLKGIFFRASTLMRAGASRLCAAGFLFLMLASLQFLLQKDTRRFGQVRILQQFVQHAAGQAAGK